jgi:hypothetical protein
LEQEAQQEQPVLTVNQEVIVLFNATVLISSGPAAEAAAQLMFHQEAQVLAVQDLQLVEISAAGQAAQAAQVKITVPVLEAAAPPAIQETAAQRTLLVPAAAAQAVKQ